MHIIFLSSFSSHIKKIHGLIVQTGTNLHVIMFNPETILRDAAFSSDFTVFVLMKGM